jgi:uncharacterized LabA/DUF88 family protein
MPRVIDYKGQRVGVFVDVQNMYYSAKNLYGKKVNFANMLRDARGERTLIRAIAYVVKADAMKESTFFDALEAIGFEIKSKDLQVFVGGAKKGDWDVGIAMDAIETAPKLDVVVIISGDGDFVPLVEHLQRGFGCKVEVMSFGKSTNATLKEVADVFTDFDQKSSRYLIGQKAR